MVRMLVVFAALVVGACGGPSRTAAPPSAAATPSATLVSPPPIAPPIASGTPSPADLPYGLSCGPVERAECEAMAAVRVAGAEKRFPGKDVRSVSITSADGDSQLLFEDGTGIFVIVN